MHRNHLCIVYEKLSLNLYEVLRKGKFRGLPLALVRRFAQQILVTLSYLSQSNIQVIHCDLKPEKYLKIYLKNVL
jgi:serine/threonine protein kinase